MRLLADLFANNRAWAAAHRAADPAFFERLGTIQRPRYLWIGCADSRVPANEIVGLAPGELFVHRNVANVVAADDVNGLSVLHYAVETLAVEHVIVCGHYGCGGVQAALGPRLRAPLEDWIGHVRRIADVHRAALDAAPDETARWRRLCELNVVAQVEAVGATAIVRAAWERRQAVAIHGWIYDLHDGLLRDLDVTVDGPSPGPQVIGSRRR